MLADPRHEPPAGPEFASLYSGLVRPRSPDFSCAAYASVADGVAEGHSERFPTLNRSRPGRFAMVAAIVSNRGELVLGEVEIRDAAPAE